VKVRVVAPAGRVMFAWAVPFTSVAVTGDTPPVMVTWYPGEVVARLNVASVATMVTCTVAGVEPVTIGPLRLAMPVAVAGASVSPASRTRRFENAPAVTATDWVVGRSTPVVAVSVAVKV
jgi:hypothetical protein